ncbi:MAG: aspartyl/asparaginyl beta-hydroxylase domain-containing protein [Hyphomonadaceae bacterium]
MSAAQTLSPQAALAESTRRLQAGDAAGAIVLLEAALHGAPRETALHIQLGVARRVSGDFAGALAAFDTALALDPYDFLALLSKGVALEKLGQPAQAARAYKAALRVAPSRPQPQFAQPIAHAKAAVAADAERRRAHLRQAVASLRGQYEAGELARFDECLDILAGVATPKVQEPAQLLFPRLAPIPFFDDALFPWMAALEAQTDVIRGELEAVLAQDWPAFRPYIQKAAGAPLNQWAPLNHNPAWSSFFFFENGARNDANCARCPRTTAILESLPLADQPGFAPTAMFSVLQPKTRIPPHTGSTNTRVIAHLPLILPEGCSYRVGNEWRQWRLGKTWVFDDTIEHEARNDSDFVRVLLIFDLWNPLMTQVERDLVSAMMLADDSYQRGGR